MKKQIASIAGWLLLFIAFGIYVYGIYFAIFLAKGPIKLPEPLDSLVTTISAILLTNFGAVLGIAIAKPASGLAQITLLGIKNSKTEPITEREIMQYVAVLLYLTVLIACFIAWAHKNFTDKPEDISALVVQHGKTLFGAIAAYIAFVLGSAPNKEPTN
jgi:peptidoglycan biosynthesis protein MviN/MurJ (putative lipid II flippase)